MKLKFALWIAVITAAFALTAAADQATVSSSTSTNGTAKATNEVVEAKIPGDIYTNSIGMVLIKLPGGYWAGKYEVTQAEYQKIMGSNPSAFAGANQPVDSLNWNDAVDFCDKMTAHDLETNAVPKGFYYTLPTEDEWESMVADASLDDAITSQNGAVRQSTSPVGSLHANSLGLYDVRGNVMEFCQGDTAKPFRVLRGGSWQDSIEQNLRTAFRYYCKPEESKNTFGFRCLLKQK